MLKEILAEIFIAAWCSPLALLISKHFKVALVSHTHHTSTLWIQAKGIRGHPQLQSKLEAELGLCENLSHKT